MDATERNEKVHRWAKAIWQSEVDAGNFSASEPLTSSLRNKLILAAYSAVGVFDAEPELLPIDFQLEWHNRLNEMGWKPKAIANLFKLMEDKGIARPS